MFMILSSTKDLISGYEYPGGPAFYSSLALYFLGLDDFIVATTRCVTYDFLKRLGVNLIPCGVGETVFEVLLNGGRTLKLVRKCSMDLWEILDKVGDYLVISLTMGEVPLDVVEELTRGRRVVVDVQGFIRSVGEDGIVFNDYLRFSQLVRLECEELVLRGEWYEFPPKCRGVGVVKCVHESGTSMIVTNGSGPTYFSTTDGVSGIIQPPQLIYGRTLGTGDVFTAVFAYEYLVRGTYFEEAVATATSAASLRVRDSLPWYTLNEVKVLRERVLNSFKRIAY